MKTTLGFLRFDLVLYLLIGLAALGLVFLAPHVFSTITVSLPVTQPVFASETQGLLSQTAQHLSKLSGGESVGGFPGFEPPPDDDKYREKIARRKFTGQDVNDWVKEINNFLNQIIQKNPGLTLREILQKEGLMPAQIENFVDALQRAQFTTDTMKSIGVNVKTAETLEALMKTLRVPLWNY